MSISQILVALLTTAGIVESREGERGLESWLSLPDGRERGRSGCGRLRGGPGTGECLNTREPNYEMSVASEIRIRACDFVVMLTSRLLRHAPGLDVGYQTQNGIHNITLGGILDHGRRRRIILSAAETPLAD